MSLKERGVSAATRVCRFNASNPRNRELKTPYNLEEGECLAHLHDGRILGCNVKTQRDLYRCADFETHEGKRIDFDKRFSI